MQLSVINYFMAYNRYLNLIGIIVILGLCILFSRNRRAIDYPLMAKALGLQILIGLIMLKTTWGIRVVGAVAGAVTALYHYAHEGIHFVFGSLSIPMPPWGMIFAVSVLPVVIFFGAFMGMLFYMGIIQRLVNGVSVLIRPILGTSGAETLCAIANSFLGQTEAPLVIRNYLCGMTKSELLVVMLSGMGTISGSILVVFSSMGVPTAHLLTAVVMAIPSTIMIAKTLYPQTERTLTAEGAAAVCTSDSVNLFDAVSAGTRDGLHLALNIGAMLIAFLGLIAFINGVLGYIGVGINELLAYAHINAQLPSLSLNLMLGWLCAPAAYLLGFTGVHAQQVGELLGTKIAINEMVAYKQMLTLGLPERAEAIVTYALCGFSNFACIGIQIGGIGALVPERREWISELGLTALFGAVLSNLLSAMIVALLI